MITLYGMSSPNVTKLTIMLRELDLPYEYRWVNLFREQQFDPEFIALNPNKKVPVLVDPRGEGAPLVLFESTAILIYLAEKEGKLLPPLTDPRRYEAMKWLMIQATGFGPMCGQYVHFNHFSPKGQDYALERYRNEVMRIYKVFDDRLTEKEWIAGDDYSIVDIALYPWAALRDQQGLSWAGLNGLQRWFDAASKRPAVVAAMTELEPQMQRDAESLRTAPAATIDRFLNRTPQPTA